MPSIEAPTKEVERYFDGWNRGFTQVLSDASVLT